MPERRVREVRQGFLQPFERTESRVRNLSLRAYRGAVRTARADAANPGVFSELVSVLELIAPSGRWLANGTATFVVPAPVNMVDLSLQVVAADPLTDEIFVGTDFDMPPGRYKAAHSSQLVMTLRCIGDLIADDNVKVTLRAMNAVGDAYTLTDLRLTLNPV